MAGTRPAMTARVFDPTLLAFLQNRRDFALHCACPLADTILDHFLDPLGNAPIALHQCVQVMRVEPQ
jgi:hypothetical protein